MQPVAGSSSSKRGQYTSRACNECRRRRCKCDGARPVCSSCLSYGHECSWSGENDAHRPPTKQLVETLRVKIQVLEDEIARLEAINHRRSSWTDGSDTVSPDGSVFSGSQTPFPRQSRLPTSNTASPRPWVAAQLLPRGRDQDERSLSVDGVGESDQHPNPIYQFIFNIDSSVPFNEQPEATSRSLSCDWSRHLPSLNGTELTRFEHDTLLDRYFKYSNCWLMSIVPHLFLRDMLRSLDRTNEGSETNHYSPPLHCSLLAFAAALSDYPAMRRREIKGEFAKKAKQLLHDDLYQPRLSLVQALAILSEYHSGIGQKEQAYMYLGMSIRATRALDPRRVESQGPNHAELLWCLWSIYSQDKLMSLELNIEFTLRSTNYDALGLPQIDWDVDHLPWSYSHSSGSETELGGECRLTQVFVESCRLMLVAESIIRLHHSHIFEARAPDNDRVVNIHWTLEAWFSELPAELTISEQSSTAPLPHVIMLNILYWWLVLRLHKPYYRRASNRNASSTNVLRPFGDLSDTLCDRAARSIMLLVGLYSRWHGSRFFPRNMIQAVFSAGSMLVQWQASLTEAETARQTSNPGLIFECISTLRAIAETWPWAEGYVNQLQAVLQDRTPQPQTQMTSYF